MDTVLVTGGTGYIARWCMASLLERGFAVRTTVRDVGKEPAIRAALAEAVEAGDRLELAVADLTADDGWDAAVAADVERVVLTSAANTSSHADYRQEGVTDETLWTDPDDPAVDDDYRVSKTLAERAAWDLAAEVGATHRLATVLPGAVLGPILGADNLGSVEVVGRLLRGELPMVARIGLEVVDVRDVAEAHVLAMVADGAAGERFLATGDLLWMTDIADLLRAELGEAAARVPTERIDDDALRELAASVPELRGVLPGLGRRNVHTTGKAERVLGWRRRPGTEAVLDCARSLLAHGVA